MRMNTIFTIKPKREAQHSHMKNLSLWVLTLTGRDGIAGEITARHNAMSGKYTLIASIYAGDLAKKVNNKWSADVKRQKSKDILSNTIRVKCDTVPQGTAVILGYLLSKPELNKLFPRTTLQTTLDVISEYEDISVLKLFGYSIHKII